jgi:drug/metabolite transporter (DMT)-like permease
MSRPHLLAFAAIFILSVMDAMIKKSSADFGTLQIVLMRFGMGALVIGVIYLARWPGWPGWEAVRVNGLRGFLVVFTALTFFYGLAVLPLAEALALSFLSPIFIAALGVLMLKEKAGGSILIGLGLGMAGMIVMVLSLQGEGAQQRPFAGILAAIASAFSYALAIVLLRARATKDAVATIVLIQHIVPALIVGAGALIVWTLVTPGMAETPRFLAPAAIDSVALLWFLGIGFCGATGHFILATAFSRAEAASLAPIDYTSLIWAVLFGYFFFDETPGWSTFAGAVLIAAGAMVASRRPMTTMIEEV